MVFASNNEGKIKDLRGIFDDVEIKSLKDVGVFIDVIEDADTFYGNALKKAKEIYEVVHEPVISDDSGLEIEALDKWPGVLTHRFVEGSDTDRCLEILRRMEGIENRKCRFVTTIVYYDGKNIISEDGILEGTISHEMKGDNGFGFDPVFTLPNGKTLAELSSSEKNAISARGKALARIRSQIKNKF